MHERLHIDHLESLVRATKSELDSQKYSSRTRELEEYITLYFTHFRQVEKLKRDNEKLKREMESNNKEKQKSYSFSKPTTPGLLKPFSSRLSLRPESRKSDSMLTTPIVGGRIALPHKRTSGLSLSRLSTPRSLLSRKPMESVPVSSPLSTPKTGSATRFNRLRQTPPSRSTFTPV
ncbi:hypothetical protein GEMRC1_006623 [Eukaryota sp. GEM-RC1]